MRLKEFDLPELFINRELSWLEFNDRVLQQGISEKFPLLERAKFLSIVSSNLDEFFMIRVAGLMQQKAAGRRKRDPSGLSPTQQLKKISKRVHQMVNEQARQVEKVLSELKHQDLNVLRENEWSSQQRSYLQDFFVREISPVLTPLAIQQLDPCPLLPGRQLNVAILINDKNTKNKKKQKKVVVIPVPDLFQRFISIPGENGTNLALLEDVVSANSHLLFQNEKIDNTAFFRITRDGDVSFQEDEAGDLLSTIEDAVLQRRRRSAVRLEISADCHGFIKDVILEFLEIDSDHIYEIDGLMDASALMQLMSFAGFDHLKFQEWPPQPPKDLLHCEDIFQCVQNHDVLLFHPYDSFSTIVQILENAAEDPDVLAIKQTLYRTSGESPIIRALEQAGENGKEVTVLVELKARFDEARNINWARKLEDAGCHVIYGVAGLKTHAKALLIVRREENRIRRYVHLATGNYNDKTAKLYSDMGIMTGDSQIASDVAAFFNLLTGFSDPVGFQQLGIAPTGLRKRFYELIEREIQASTPDRPGVIMAKVNSLEDKEMCKELYRASKAGVKIQLNVRGICCLRPGIKGVSENIEVVSIIDRFLEHTRIFYFNNGGHDEIYLSSADWMGRNLDKRLEILFPVIDMKIKRRIRKILDTYFSDNMQAYCLNADGTYSKKRDTKNPVRAQELFYQYAVKAVKVHNQANLKFRPVTHPDK